MKFKLRQIVETPTGDIGIVEDFGVDTVHVTVRGNAYSTPFNPKDLKKCKTVKTIEGERIAIKAHQEALRDYAVTFRAWMDDKGKPGIIGAVSRVRKCGCKVVGNGTLQFPIMVQPCEKHRK